MPLVTELDLAIQETPGSLIGVVIIHDDAIVGHNRRMYHLRHEGNILHCKMSRMIGGYRTLLVMK
jgi:hypothetical protein